MNGNQVLILVALIIGTDLLIVPLIIKAVVNGNWNPIAAKYLPVPPQSGAVHRTFQSFSVGSLSLGGCIHVGVDESHLHLAPCWFARRMRIRPASIPWSQLELVKSGRRQATVRVQELTATTLRGPRWCLELAGSPKR